MNDEWMLPGTPREQYVTALRLLAGQCEAVARRIEAGDYPYYPHGNLDLLARTHVAALAAEAAREAGR